MKFGKRLKDEIVPEWAEHYVSYKRLKRLIRNSELTGSLFRKELLKVISEELGKAEELFQELIDELQRGYERLIAINPDRPIPKSMCFRKFYPRRLHKRFDTAVSEDSMILTSHSSMNDTESQIEEHRDEGFASFFKGFFFFAIGDSKIKFVGKDTPRAQFLEWYTNAHQLQHFTELNLEAIRKASKKLKKYRHMDADYADAIEAELSRSRLTTLMPRLYKLISHASMDYEKKFKDPLDQYANVVLSEGWSIKWGYIFFAILLFSLTLHAPFLVENLEAHNCVALFVLVVVLWITEAVPFFCTAMLIPLVAVPLRIITDPSTGAPVSHSVASRIILGKVFSQVQILLISGLTIGKACTRTNLQMYAISAIHRYTAHRPNMYLLCIMASSCLLCAFVSNIAAPLLVLEIIQCTLWEFLEGTTAPHAILLGLAFACNLGGMLSPIASPQNAIAMSILSPNSVTFSMWMWVALPIVSICLFASWLIIIIMWRPFKDIPYIPLQVVNAESDKEVSVVKRTVVLVVSMITIMLWVLPEHLSLGDTDMIALIPIVTFFSTGILSKDDFHTLSWSLIFLLAGGNMLSLCARDSKMLDVVVGGLNSTISAVPPPASLVLIILLMGLVSTLVPHTVAAMVMLPLIEKSGQLIQPSSGPFSATPDSLILLCTLMCSGAMAFPISSFPNINSLLAGDPKGNAYLRSKNFLPCGLLIQLIFSVSLVTWMVPLTNITLDWQWP